MTETAADDFREHIERNKVLAFDLPSPRDDWPSANHSFFPIGVVRDDLTDAKIRRLIHHYERPCTVSHVKTIREVYLVVFAILVYIGKGSFIDKFCSYREFDGTHLPFLNDTGWPPECDWFDKFKAAQWRFCALLMQSTKLNGVRCRDEMIIPIIRIRKFLKPGSDAWTRVVTIHPDYNFLVDRDNGPPTANDFVMKSCDEDNVPYHHPEVEAYRALSDQEDILDNIPKFYGSCTQGGVYHILLEYVVGGTLSTFFEKEDPPTTEEDIRKFWGKLLVLTKVVDRIHKHPSSRHRGEIREGHHNDIRPENIFVSERMGPSRFDVEFKLGDFGLASFAREGEDARGASRRAVPGFQVYSSPECFLDERDGSSTHDIIVAHSSKDIWSLGCVFSIAAVWSVNGGRGVRDYERTRKEATEAIPQLRQTGYNGCFHDTERVLKAVLTVHNRVRNERRLNDGILKDILAVIEEMLEDTDSRPTAKQCHTRFQRALEPFRQQSIIEGGELPESAYPSAFRIGPVRQEPPMPPPDSDDEASVVEVCQKQPLQPEAQPSPDTDTATGPASKVDAAITNDGRRSIPTPEGSSTRKSTPSAISAQSPKGSLDPTELPYATVKDVMRWESSRKRRCRRLLDGYDYLKYLDGRDHSVLFDNSSSMGKETTGQSRWKDGISTFAAISYVYKRRSPGGIDLRFANDPTRRMRHRHRKSLLKHLNSKEPAGSFDIGSALDKVLEPYDPEKLQKEESRRECSRKKWGVTVYVLTDGNWLSNKKHLSGVVEAIKNMVDKLVAAKMHPSRVGIQFIQLGDDSVGTNNLKVLDDELEERGVKRDIVDTEPSTGNIFKMLCGSIDPRWDNQVSKPPDPSAPSSERHLPSQNETCITRLRNIFTWWWLS